MAAEIQLIGSNTPAIVDDHNREFISQWTWHAIERKGNIHAAARIAGRNVLMEEVVFWAALVQGAKIDPDGSLTKRTFRLEPATLRAKLEAVLRRRSLGEELGVLMEEAEWSCSERRSPRRKKPSLGTKYRDVEYSGSTDWIN
jgi:hypothetical protein